MKNIKTTQTGWAYYTLFLIKMLLGPKLRAPPWILLEEFRALPHTPSRCKVTNDNHKRISLCS